MLSNSKNSQSYSDLKNLVMFKNFDSFHWFLVAGRWSQRATGAGTAAYLKTPPLLLVLRLVEFDQSCLENHSFVKRQFCGNVWFPVPIFADPAAGPWEQEGSVFCLWAVVELGVLEAYVPSEV